MHAVLDTALQNSSSMDYAELLTSLLWHVGSTKGTHFWKTCVFPNLSERIVDRDSTFKLSLEQTKLLR